jgi:hypothetical protein
MRRAIKWVVGLIICIIGVLTTPVLIGIYIFAIGAAMMEDE